MAASYANVINMKNGGDLDRPIYRVFNYQRLLTLFELRKNTLVKPVLWDDPFENFILETASKALSNYSHYDFEARNNFFGQCWSLLEESDAMWRIYSPDKMGVKVKTTIRKLFDSLLNSIEVESGHCFVGKVKYMDSELLKDKLMDMAWLDMEMITYDGQAASLLVKRLEFTHEQEVRLLFLNPRPDETTKLFQYSIDPMELFEEIQFDPRISTEMFSVFQFYLQDKIGYKKPISQSELYKVPKLNFR